MAHLIWKVDTRSISNIEHRNVATVADIFYGCHNGLFEVILLQQYAELTLDELPQLNEVELSSSCEQVTPAVLDLVGNIAHRKCSSSMAFDTWRPPAPRSSWKTSA